MTKKLRILTAIIMIACICAFAAACSSGAKAPDVINLDGEGYIFRAAGETYNLAEDLKFVGENVSEEVDYSVSDTAVAEISEEGVLTVTGSGTARVTVTSAADESVSVSADILVYDYTGVYTGEKYIEAMGCDIRISLSLAEDGSFEFYRYPMYVNLEGGGRMEGMTDSGTYVIRGNEMTLTADYLGEFTLSLMLNEAGKLEMSGDTPTGGATTAMTLTQYSSEDQGEAGTYTGNGDREDGEAVSYTLTLESGTYVLMAAVAGEEITVSSGKYYFADTEMEFVAEEGATFWAIYDAGRQVVEGTEIPVSADGSYAEIPATLTKQN